MALVHPHKLHPLRLWRVVGHESLEVQSAQLIMPPRRRMHALPGKKSSRPRDSTPQLRLGSPKLVYTSSISRPTLVNLLVCHESARRVMLTH